MNPRVSIILPTYREALFIREAIESVQSQSFTDWELIIVDDGMYNTSAIKNYLVTDKRIIYLKNENNLGIQKSLNRGINISKGQYIGRIDDDDIWIDNLKLERQVKFLNDNTDYVLVGTGAVVCDENGKFKFNYNLPGTNEKIRKNILSKNCFVHSSVLFRKGDGVIYDDSINTKHVEDYDLWVRLGLIGKLYNLPTHSVRLTDSPDGLSSKNRIRQSFNMLRTVIRYRGRYPHYIKGMFISILRAMLSIVFPIIPKRLVFFIKKIYKETS